MNSNTQLPDEVKKEIIVNAEEWANKNINGRSNPKDFERLIDAYIALETLYATKLHEAAKENEALKSAFQSLVDVLPKGQALHDYFAKFELIEARHVLVLYNNKTFLDGTK